MSNKEDLLETLGRRRAKGQKNHRSITKQSTAIPPPVEESWTDVRAFKKRRKKKP